MIKDGGFEMFEARVVDIDECTLYTVVRWSEAGARTRAEQWWNAFIRGLK